MHGCKLPMMEAEEKSVSDVVSERLDTPHKRTIKTEEQLLAAAKMIKDGAPLQDALLAAGYSKGVARQGKNAISRRMRRAIIKEGLQMTDIGRAFNAQQQEEMVRGVLVTRAALDRDVKAAELLGKDKRVNMFASEQMTGVIVLQVPTQIQPGAAVVGNALPVMDAEVIETKEVNLLPAIDDHSSDS